MGVRGIDEAWLGDRVRESSTSAPAAGDEVAQLRELLLRCAEGFCERRADVVSPGVAWPRRGLGADEARSFLRAVEHGIAAVDDAGYVTLPPVRPKTPTGRYALLSRSGDGVSVNLEYLIQIGATAELVLDHGWPPETVNFERGEFDALCVDPDNRVLLAMEAKARVTGPDSLERLVASWLQLIEHADADRATNAGRKFTELGRLTERGKVLVWLVADGARWPLWADQVRGQLSLSPAPSAHRTAVLAERPEEPLVLEAHPYNPSLHRPSTAAHDGGCSWHGPVSCPQPPVISFQDTQGKWQSGCQRAVEELTARGEIASLQSGHDR
jgi:hypothetical protein